MTSKSHDRVAATWQHLIEIYGAQWANTFGMTAPPLWRAALDALDDEQLRRGIEYFALDASGAQCFPPNLPEFRFRCLGAPSQFDAVSECIRAVADASEPTSATARRMFASVSYWDRRSLPEPVLRRRFADAWQGAIAGGDTEAAAQRPRLASDGGVLTNILDHTTRAK